MKDFRLHGYKINLQLFAEKTEKPTAKKRAKAAEKGQLARSPEINSVLVLLVGFLAIRLTTPAMIDGWAVLTSDIYHMFEGDSFTIDFVTLRTITIMTLAYSARIMVPIAGGVLVAGVIASLFQIGFHFNMSAIKFDLKNIDPIAGLKRLLSLQALVELIKSVCKIILIGVIVYLEFSKHFMEFTRLTDMNLRASAAFIGEVTFSIVFKVIIWLIVLAVADHFFQRWWHEKKLMMEKQEVKDEHKQTDGDPQIKGKIRQKQRQMSMMRMMQALPKADVVITNPTHFAVALQYDTGTMAAPQVIAKGQDRMALKIREVAKEHGIVTVENKPLAQSLFYNTEIGDSIPSELYQAVAEVLAFVYRLKGKI